VRFALSSVLDYYGVDYRPHRTTQKVLCVVHGESDPSCNVDFEKGLWYCHSCGEGGTAIDMIMKKEGLDYESARTFAEDSGIEGEGVDGRSDGVQLGIVARKRLPGSKRDQQSKRRYVPAWRRS
jgi:DNA primase